MCTELPYKSDYFKKIRVTTVALCDVALFTLKIHFIVECVNISSFVPAGKLQLPMHWFWRNSQIWTAFCAYPLFQMSSKSDNECGKRVYQFVYNAWSLMVFTVLISVKLTITQWIFVGTFCTKFHLNLIKKYRKFGQNFIFPPPK